MLLIKEYKNTDQGIALVMANIFHRCIEFVPVAKYLPLPAARETMGVNPSDIVAQRETFEVVLLCSNGPRRKRPPLPPEGERSS